MYFSHCNPFVNVIFIRLTIQVSIVYFVEYPAIQEKSSLKEAVCFTPNRMEVLAVPAGIGYAA
jgi:hypothetical protein